MYDITEEIIEDELASSEVSRQRGASLVEYALLIALIAVVCIAAVTALGGTTQVPYSDLTSGIS